MKLYRLPYITLILLFIGVVAVLLISIRSLYLAYISYEGNSLNQAAYQLMLGVLGIISSTYIIAKQLKRRQKMTNAKSFDVITTIECGSCGLKSVRSFVKSDYVFKPMDKCPKCGGEMFITSIYQKEEKKA